MKIADRLKLAALACYIMTACALGVALLLQPQPQEGRGGSSHQAPLVADVSTPFGYGETLEQAAVSRPDLILASYE
ncbi:MAG: hypothetical protein H6854_01010 [Rhodospirillales bacterium]|nr:hypothetical protein [Rhodospirillales bacterium]